MNEQEIKIKRYNPKYGEYYYEVKYIQDKVLPFLHNFKEILDLFLNKKYESVSEKDSEQIFKDHKAKVENLIKELS